MAVKKTTINKVIKQGDFIVFNKNKYLVKGVDGETIHVSKENEFDVSILSKGKKPAKKSPTAKTNKMPTKKVTKKATKKRSTKSNAGTSKLKKITTEAKKEYYKKGNKKTWQSCIKAASKKV